LSFGAHSLPISSTGARRGALRATPDGRAVPRYLPGSLLFRDDARSGRLASWFPGLHQSPADRQGHRLRAGHIPGPGKLIEAKAVVTAELEIDALQSAVALPPRCRLSDAFVGGSFHGLVLVRLRCTAATWRSCMERLTAVSRNG